MKAVLRIVLRIREENIMTELFEILMIIAFGISWPINVLKSYRARTAKGKSFVFLLLIFCGYICGIIGKLIAPSFKWYVLFFYVLNLIMVGLDLILYIRNMRLDRRNGSTVRRHAL